MYVALREQGLSNREIAKRLGVDEASVRRGLKTAHFRPYLIPNYAQRALAVELEQPIRWDVAEKGAGGVIADVHLPLTDWSLLNTFIDHARDIKATNWLLIAGDLFNIDALSSFDFKQDSANLPAELFAGEVTMRALLETFNEIVISWGNHDSRVHKALGYKVDFVTAMRMMFAGLDRDEMSRVRLTNLDHVVIDTPRGPYYVAHPKAYSQVPLTNARRMASKELMNVVTGHSHHTAIGHDVSGRFVCAEVGGFFDASKTAYLQRSTSYPKWQNGYGFIDRDGFLIVEGQGWSSRMGKRA